MHLRICCFVYKQDKVAFFITFCYFVLIFMTFGDFQNYMTHMYIKNTSGIITVRESLAQLVKASVGQADVQRFEPHLGHNRLSCGVLLVKSRHFGLPMAQTIMAKLAISVSGWLGRYTNVEYLQSLYLKRRGQLLFQV